MDSNNLALTTMSVTQGITLFTALMPDRSRLFATSPTDPLCANVLQGEVMATALTLGFAALLALAAKNPLPLIAAGGTCVTMIAAYEITLRTQGANHGQLA